jgi:hypothetical protein
LFGSLAKVRRLKGTRAPHEGTDLALKQYQLGRYRVLQDAREVHRIVEFVLHLNDLLEREVVVPVSQRVEVDISVVLASIV